eukprot:TRINITY_DN13243_c0_g1_i2.p2 TRINITY_DN13243_c0_g1~~TRINITY_DN13243_c0_g1_i2.p2  ORF type:complete len:124 (-),score=12.41 TRINITY_DN13243_c0_g1_i2:99-470(-)
MSKKLGEAVQRQHGVCHQQAAASVRCRECPRRPSSAARAGASSAVGVARRMFASVVERYRGLPNGAMNMPSTSRLNSVVLGIGCRAVPANTAHNSHLKELSLHRARRHSERCLLYTSPSPRDS